MKMVAKFANAGHLNQYQLEYSIRRNFGGLDLENFDPVNVFKKHAASEWPDKASDDILPTTSTALIKSSLSGEHTGLKGWVKLCKMLTVQSSGSIILEYLLLCERSSK